MSTSSLKSLAKKAGKALETAEKYWKEAKADAKKQGKGENYAYVTGIVKKRLGLESIDLLSCGSPIDCVVESDLEESRIKTERVNGFNRTVALSVLSEILRVEVGRQKSNIVFINEDGSASVRPSFRNQFEGWVSEKRSMDDLRKLFPNTPEQYLQFLVECFTPEMLKKLFPNADQDYVKFMSEQ